MLHITRVTLLSALVAMSANAQRAEGPVSPVPMMAIDTGTVIHIDQDGSRVIADCRQLRELHISGGPRKGQIDRTWEPCLLLNLTVHPQTGRWAMSTSVMGDTDWSHRLINYQVAGREIPLPRDRAGRVKDGNFLVLGDRQGVVAVTPGVPETWTYKEDLRFQHPMAFTQDGSRVLVLAGNSSRSEWWSWSFGAQPEALRVLPPGMSDGKATTLVAGEHRTVLKHPREGVRVATLEPTGTRPWKVGRRLGLERRGLLTPLVLGDTIVFYREGEWRHSHGDCDESKPGTYRRFELSTGQERVWRRHEGWCSTVNFVAASPLRRTVYFTEITDVVKGSRRLVEYALDRDETRELPIEGYFHVLDISEDGRLLLVRTTAGLVVHDVVAARSTPVPGVQGNHGARLLALP
jgi:hypothetical protein